MVVAGGVMFRYVSIIAGLIFILFSLAFAQGENGEYYFKFKIDSRDNLDKITRVISIDNVKGDTVYAYANFDEFTRFAQLGYSVTILPNPGSLIMPKMADSPGMLTDWDSYPTYTAYVAMMDSFAINYPSLCQIVNFGTTNQGRALLIAKISANVSVEENEPEVLYTSSMHGDEVTGYVLMLRLINYLLTNYGIDTAATTLINNMEIWINPLANPDGTYRTGNNSVSGAIRGNYNGIDLNRNFPDAAMGAHPDGNAWQVETQAWMTFAAQHSFALSANFHGGAEVVNYPWDCFSRLHPDNTWWVSVSRQYADTVHNHAVSGYMNYLNNGITNGYAWYPVYGGRQDYFNYFKGGRECTIELSDTKLLPAAQLPAHWEYNYRSLINYLRNALYGVRGLVTDASTGLPVAATVWVLGHDADSSRVFTDPQVGDYHRMIAPGTWNLKFTAPGYVDQTINGVVVTSNAATTVNVQLQPMAIIPDLAFSKHNVATTHAGDTIAMKITLVNNGAGNATGTTGILSTTDSYVTVIQNTSTYPTMTALGGTGVSISDYQFVISPSCPTPHQISFRLDLTASGGYSDTVMFNVTAGVDVENFETGNFNAYPWTFAGNGNWTITSSGPYEGTYSAKSGTITHSQTSQLQVVMNVAQAGTISFYYKVSSEASYDSLRFLIDNTLKGGWSGEVGWAIASYAVTAGNHTFKWIYKKDGSESNGSDCAWVDFITFPPLGQPLVITTTTLPNWTANFAYSQQLQATGGTGTKTWSDLYGNLSGTGLTLSTAGLLSGMPNAGTISFSARVQDQASAADTQALSFVINPALQITTDSLTAAVVGAPYAVQLLATGGTGAKSWADRDSDLVSTGLVLSSDGYISGIPTIGGIINLIARVQDQVGAYVDKPLTLVIYSTMVITTDSLPGGLVGSAYSAQLTVVGGIGNKTWSDLNNDLDSTGLALSANGLISGTPLRADSIAFTARVIDSLGASVQKQLTIVVSSDFLAGDANGDGQVRGSDVTRLVGFFKGLAAPPSPLLAGDANGDCLVSGGDVTYLVRYFKGFGDPPFRGDCR